jgi:thiol-disulfide isomerase/thioredoxin
MKTRTAFAPLAFAVLATVACASASGPAGSASQPEDTPVLVGPVTREAIEEAMPAWVQAQVEAELDAEAARGLASVEPGAELTVYLGTWCGDSRREVPRFWRALDESGGMVPFEVRYVGVDREKKEPAEAVISDDVRYVPTFIVRRGGQEVGRIVEESPNGLETDLLALFRGEARGVISTRDDLTSGSGSR